jgi:hypothetical protein
MSSQHVNLQGVKLLFYYICVHLQVATVSAERGEAVRLLESYRGSISQLQDRHSAAAVQAQNEKAKIKSEV